MATGPRPTRPIPDAVVQARMRLRAHDLAGVLAALDAEQGLDAGRPERTWLLAHVRAGSGERAKVRNEVSSLAPGSYRTALLASLDEDPAHARRTLELARAGRGDPWLAISAAWLAELRGDRARAWGYARAARGGGLAYVDVESWLVQARVLLEEGRLDGAVEAARQASKLEPTDTRARLVEAAAARRAGRIEDALDAWMAAVDQIPANQAYPRRIASLLRRYDDRELALRVAGRLGPRLTSGTCEHVALSALLAARVDDVETAAYRYEEALAAGALPVPVDRDLRRLHVRAGRYERALELLMRAVPGSVVEDPRNVLAGRWTRLAAAGRAAPDVGAPPAARLALARALVGVGALVEAEAVLDRLQDPESLALGRRVASQLAFEDALETYLEGGFRLGHRKADPPDLPVVLRDLSRLAQQHLPADEAVCFQGAWRGLRRVPVIGGWLDHGARTTSPAVEHFRRYGRFLVLGQREGQPTEAIVLSLASLVPDQEIRTRGGLYRHDVAVGYDRRLGSWLEAAGGGLGGACLPDGIWMDADSAREVEAQLRRGLTIDPHHVGRLLEAERLLPPDGPGGVFGMTDPAGVAARLVTRYVARCPDDPWGTFGTLTAHEYGHVVEIKRHLPILKGLPASMALIASRGFSPHHVERELERRAQLAALAESPHPDLALAEMVSSLPIVEKEPEVHAAGYHDAVLGIAVEVWKYPARYPSIDRRARILPQLDALTNAQIRQAARAVLR